MKVLLDGNCSECKCFFKAKDLNYIVANLAKICDLCLKKLQTLGKEPEILT